VFINRLESSVMGNCAVAQGKPPWASNAFAGLLAAHNLGFEKKGLDLVLGKSSLIRRADDM
jgi:hypothetical protein